MAKAMTRAVGILPLFVAFCLVSASHAQMVASRDLTTGWSVPAEHVPAPGKDACPNVQYSVSDGDKGTASKQQTEGERLELKIVEISPPKLRIGADFTATVQLKNTGTTAVLIPATADGGQLTGSAAKALENKTEEKYEVADVSFRLATDKEHRSPIFLTSAGALFADPDDKNTYVALAPGNWLNVKLTGTVECGAAKCVGGLQPDNDGVLTAWWYQRLLTHRVSGCEENHGSINVRQVDSAPFRVAVRSSANKSHNGPKT